MASNRSRLVGALGFLLLGAACQPSPPSPPAADSLAQDTTPWTTYLNQSLTAFARGDTTQALAYLAKALHQDSTQPFLYELQGYYFYTQGRDSLAIRAYQRAFELGGATPQLHYRMGSAYLVQQHWKNAYYHFAQALAADSDNPEVWTALGLWAHLQGKRNEAIRYWKEALRRDSTQEKPRTFLYDVYLYELGQPDTARRYFLDPYWKFERFHPLLNFQLGNYHLAKYEAAQSQGRTREAAAHAFQAVEAYTRALLAHPSYAKAYYNRGLVYFKVGKYDRALADFEQAAQLNPHDEKAPFMAGSLYELRKDTARACQAYRQAVTRKPDFPEAQKALAELHCP